MLLFGDKLTFVSKKFIKGFWPQLGFLGGRSAKREREHQTALLRLHCFWGAQTGSLSHDLPEVVAVFPRLLRFPFVRIGRVLQEVAQSGFPILNAGRKKREMPVKDSAGDSGAVPAGEGSEEEPGEPCGTPGEPCGTHMVLFILPLSSSGSLRRRLPRSMRPPCRTASSSALCMPSRAELSWAEPSWAEPSRA